MQCGQSDGAKRERGRHSLSSCGGGGSLAIVLLNTLKWHEIRCGQLEIVSEIVYLEFSPLSPP
jgi:hypothetical protein